MSSQQNGSAFSKLCMLAILKKKKKKKKKAQEDLGFNTGYFVGLFHGWLKVTSISIDPRFLLTAFSNCSQQMLGFYAVGITTVHG